MKTRAQRRNSISRWYVLGILLAGGGVAGTGLWAWNEHRTTLARVTAQQASPDAALPVLVDEDSLKVTVPVRIKDSAERPLWASTRRPYVAPSPPKKPPPKKAPTPPKEIPPLEGTLSSVILAENMQMVFVNTATGIVRLEPGMAYNGWVLANINEDSAEFHHDDEEQILQLRHFATVNATPTKSLGGEKNNSADKRADSGTDNGKK